MAALLCRLDGGGPGGVGGFFVFSDIVSTRLSTRHPAIGAFIFFCFGLLVVRIFVQTFPTNATKDRFGIQRVNRHRRRHGEP